MRASNWPERMTQDVASRRGGRLGGTSRKAAGKPAVALSRPPNVAAARSPLPRGRRTNGSTALRLYDPMLGSLGVRVAVRCVGWQLQSSALSPVRPLHWRLSVRCTGPPAAACRRLTRACRKRVESPPLRAATGLSPSGASASIRPEERIAAADDRVTGQLRRPFPRSDAQRRPAPKAAYLGQLKNGTWRSLVARLTGGQEVAGSNPVVPTKKEVTSSGPVPKMSPKSVLGRGQWGHAEAVLQEVP